MTHYTLLRHGVIGTLTGALLFTSVGCNRGLSRHEKGALIGGGAGAGVGALMGGGTGAVVGGALGAGGGALGAEYLEKRDRD